MVDGSTTAWRDGWYVVNSNVTIGNLVTVSGTVHLILADNASLTVNGGIKVAEGNSFSVYAQSVGKNVGTLTATGENGAGIGGGSWGNAGTITINGGSVTATGGYNQAGIGGGDQSSGGTVTISGGNVTATGGQEAAGIGSGFEGSGGNITIHGGSITATGGGPAAGIGSGQDSSGGNITIHGGSVTAIGGNLAAGIGGGFKGSGGNITINGGNVTATGADEGAGIGDGSGGSGGSFTTGTDGHALIFANGGISDTSNRDSWSGIIFEGDTGEVYKDQTLQENIEIPSGKTLTVPENTTLTVKDGVTLTNNGTITGNGTLDGKGNLAGSGTVAQTITNNLQTVEKPGSGGGSYYPYTPSTPSTPSAPNLDKTKTDSTTALNAAASANKYDAAEQAEVKKILDKANADIKNAKTEAEVKAIEEAAQAEIDKILTTEEKAIVAALDNVEKRDFATKSKVITRKGGKKVIRLTWTAPDGVDVDGYEIFRSTKKNSGFGKKPYFTTSNTSYTNTKDLKAGKTYYYKVRAFVVINGERVYTDYSLKANRKL